jgi:hypothetical protein
VTKGLSIFQLYFDGKRWLDSVCDVEGRTAGESNSARNCYPKYAAEITHLRHEKSHLIFAGAV